MINDKTKMHLIKRPESILFLASILIFLTPFIFWGESIGIDILGIKVFIDGITTIVFLGIVMITYGILYRILTRYLVNRVLIWSHILITIGIVGYFLVTGTWYLKMKASSESEAFILKQLLISQVREINILSFKGIIFWVGQLLFVINLTMGLTKRVNVSQ